MDIMNDLNKCSWCPSFNHLKDEFFSWGSWLWFWMCNQHIRFRDNLPQRFQRYWLPLSEWCMTLLMINRGFAPPGETPLPEPMLTRSMTPYIVARSQWIKQTWHISICYHLSTLKCASSWKDNGLFIFTFRVIWYYALPPCITRCSCWWHGVLHWYRRTCFTCIYFTLFNYSCMYKDISLTFVAFLSCFS